MRYYIDCEFDGHNGALLSMAVVKDNGASIYIIVDAEAKDPWVIENVMPLMHNHRCQKVHIRKPYEVGGLLRDFVTDYDPIIVADSPVDIGRFCQAISTSNEGGWASTDYPMMRFEVHNVDCYPTDVPGAAQHNAWWDAVVLRHLITGRKTEPTPG